MEKNTKSLENYVNTFFEKTGQIYRLLGTNEHYSLGKIAIKYRT